MNQPVMSAELDLDMPVLVALAVSMETRLLADSPPADALLLARQTRALRTLLMERPELERQLSIARVDRSDAEARVERMGHHLRNMRLDLDAAGAAWRPIGDLLAQAKAVVDNGGLIEVEMAMRTEGGVWQYTVARITAFGAFSATFTCGPDRLARTLDGYERWRPHRGPVD
jgi:hypothetical protein